MWKLSASRVRATQQDTWHELNLVPTEIAKRYRYSPRKGVWTEDEVKIKVEEKVWIKMYAIFFTSSETISGNVCCFSHSTKAR